LFIFGLASKTFFKANFSPHLDLSCCSSFNVRGDDGGGLSGAADDQSHIFLLHNIVVVSHLSLSLSLSLSQSCTHPFTHQNTLCWSPSLFHTHAVFLSKANCERERFIISHTTLSLSLPPSLSSTIFIYFLFCAQLQCSSPVNLFLHSYLLVVAGGGDLLCVPPLQRRTHIITPVLSF